MFKQALHRYNQVLGKSNGLILGVRFASAASEAQSKLSPDVPNLREFQLQERKKMRRQLQKYNVFIFHFIFFILCVCACIRLVYSQKNTQK